MDDGGDTKSAMTEGCQSDLGIAPWKKKARPTIRKAPSPRPDELKSRRRSMFLRKVHEGREDKRFEARSEHVSLFFGRFVRTCCFPLLMYTYCLLCDGR